MAGEKIRRLISLKICCSQFDPRLPIGLSAIGLNGRLGAPIPMLGLDLCISAK